MRIIEALVCNKEEDKNAETGLEGGVDTHSYKLVIN